VDNTELITGSDPNDPLSVPEETFLEYFVGSFACDDGVDNDLDGAADHGGDSGCNDDDFDIVSNELETNLGSDPESESSRPENTRFDALFESLGYSGLQTCDNEQDDDDDGATDGDDSGCDPIDEDLDTIDDGIEKLFGSNPDDPNSVPEHELANPGSCSDSTDNDRDGVADAADPACRSATNDDFADARSITSIPFEDQLKITSATAELGEPRSECGFGGDEVATVWYEYTPPANTALVVDTTGTNFSNSVAVWTQSDDRFDEVACAGYSTSNPELDGARAPFRAFAGETYYIQIVSFIAPEQPADLAFSLEVAHPPANDNFASAAQITSLPFDASLDVTDATTEEGEPDGDCSGAEPYSSVWYRYVSPGDQLLIASTAGSEYSSRISVWTDTPFGLSEIACAGSRGRVAFDGEDGRAYFIQIYASSEGFASQLNFSLELSAPPPNDDFADATNVTSLPFEDTVDTFTATREPGEPETSCSFGEVERTVWYRITVQQSGYISTSVSTVDGDFAPAVIGAYQGTSLASLTEVACVSPYFEGPSSFAIAVEAGETYYIQAHSLFFEEADEITVRFDLLTVPSCAPAEFTVQDAPADPFVFGPEENVVDATSVSGGDDGANYCVHVQFARPLPDTQAEFGDVASASIGFDTDSNTETGFNGVGFPCNGGFEFRGVLGTEVAARFDLNGQVVVPLQMPGPPRFGKGGLPLPQPDPVFGFVLVGERSLQFIVPMSVLGDDEFFFAMSFNGLASSDCLPNGGGIMSPAPADLGDINCDGATNSLDSTLILQRFAGLLTQPLVCEYLGDVNQDASAGPIDAVLILQYSSGLLSEFPIDR